MSDQPKAASNPAQVRGDIQSGRTGDKRRGFDPAAAPLETDAEAAGTPPGPEAVEEARAGQVAGRPIDTSTEYSDAMRPPLPDAGARTDASRTRFLVLALVFVCLVVAVGAYAVGLLPP